MCTRRAYSNGNRERKTKSIDPGSLKKKSRGSYQISAAVTGWLRRHLPVKIAAPLGVSCACFRERCPHRTQTDFIRKFSSAAEFHRQMAVRRCFFKKVFKKNHPLRARARSAGFMRMSLLFWNNAPLFSHISGGHSPWSLFNFLCMHESLCFGKTDEKPILNTFYLKWEQLEQQSRSIFDVVSTFLGGQWLKRCMDFVVRLYLSEFCQLLQI